MKSQIFLLAVLQGIMMSGNALLFASGSLIGQALHHDKLLASLPLALQTATTLVATAPASLLMGKFGRKVVFLIAHILALTGSIACLLGLIWQNFLVFCLGTALYGLYIGAGAFYRFAAVDVSSEKFRPKAISFVLTGGIAAALLGPNLNTLGLIILPGKTSEIQYMPGYLLVTGLIIFSLILSLFLKIPLVRAETLQAKRTFAVLLKETQLGTAVFLAAGSLALMALVMTATPLAMHAYKFDFKETAFVIQSHMLGMYVPSLFTGKLIARFGLKNVMIAGVIAFILSVSVANTGNSLVAFATGLTLLGMGWNFLFIGATNLLTRCYEPSEKAKVQGYNDFIVSGMGTVAVVSAGILQNSVGWQLTNLFTLPVLFVFGLLVLYKVKEN